MKKIMFIHHGDINGGAPKSLKSLIENLDHSVFESLVVYRCNYDDGRFFSGKNVKTVFEPKIKPFHGSTVSGINFKQIVYNFVYALPSFFAAKALIKKEKPDIIHLNSTCLFMCAKAAKKVDKRIKVICHIREPLLKGIWGNILKKMNYKYVDDFIAIDEYDARTVDKKLTKTEVIYNFVDFSKYNAEIRSNLLKKSFNLGDDSVVFTSLCRVSPENGVLELIEEWVKVISNRELFLIIVGVIPNREVEYLQKCKSVCKNNKNVIFMNFVPDVQSVIASSDVLICPFTKPHFARSIMEFGAMGKPSICNYVDGPKELIINGETGLFYNFEGATLKQCVDFFSKKENRVEFGKKAEAFARQNFDSKTNSARTIKHYNLP